jgi:predicted porin
MKIKNAIVLSLAAALSGTSVQADEAPTVYGKLFLTYQYSEEGTNNFTEVKSNASRIGIKGKSKFETGIEAFYKLEWEVDVADKSGSDNIKSRDQYVGLRGSMGNILIGRKDVPLKVIGKKIDLFNDLESDLKHTLNGETRKNNLIQYESPTFAGGFKFIAAAISGEDPANNNNGPIDANSVVFSYENNGWFLGVSQNNNVDAEGEKTTRFVSQYKVSDYQFGLLAQQADNGINSENGYGGSFQYSFGNNAFKLQHIKSDINLLGVNSKVKLSKQSTIGIDHKLSKKTKLIAFYATGETAVGVKNNQLAIGIEHKF